MNIKQEFIDPPELPPQSNSKITPGEDDEIIGITSSSDYSDSESELDESGINESPFKRQKIQAVLPVGFLDPLPAAERLAMQKIVGENESNVSFPIVMGEPSSDLETVKEVAEDAAALDERCKQFWKAGDYDGGGVNAASQAVGMDHLRVHPKFLHSNATSHKWALGAFAELLDNALDEVSSGATYVHVNMIKSKKDNSAMLVIEDDGGGMTPDKIRQCMSLGYSEKSKLANTIGQYGNGFKTSTMRLGADVIVFSRCKGKDMRSATQSIGMLSYTFLRRTGKEDIVVPMIDYEKRGKNWETMVRSTSSDWNRNLETMLRWAPYEGKEDLLKQFDFLKEQGTRIVIYNLWEDDQGKPELDFDSDKHDIQIRGVNRDEKKISMAKEYPNSKHFLTYRHSLRNYASILYLRIPTGFRIIIRGKDVEHHNLVNDMMYSETITYRPQGIPEETPKDPNMFALLKIGFVKDATHHIDVQGFNVYHKNRLIKPFWRVWNAAGSDGRGVIGVLEANFVEPAHDKQSFERTIVFSRLEARLVALQKNYWAQNCHLVGYAKRRHAKNSISAANKTAVSDKDKQRDQLNLRKHAQSHVGPTLRSSSKGNTRSTTESAQQDEIETTRGQKQVKKGPSSSRESQPENSLSNGETDHILRRSARKIINACRDLKLVNPDTDAGVMLKKEIRELKDSLEDVLHDLQYERDRSRSLEDQLQEKEYLIEDFLEEKSKRDIEFENLRKKSENASETIENLRNKVKLLEATQALAQCKKEK